jgi:hypothetical protein
MKSKLSVHAWGQAKLHDVSLVRIKPTSYQKYSSLQLAFGQLSNIFHFRIFGYAVYVPIAQPQRTKMRLQRRLGIYIGFDSPSIIRYLEPLTSDIFKARFKNCHFDENIFPSLGREKSLPKTQQKTTLNNLALSHFGPRTNQCELEVQRIIHLQSIANQLPGAFIVNKKIVKSHISATNTPTR